MTAQLPLLAATDVAGSSSDQELPATHNVTSGPSQGEGDGPGVATTPARGTAEDPAASGRVRGEQRPDAALVHFSVYGTPVPQGSHKAFVVNGHAKVTEDNVRSRPWRQDLIHAAIDALGDTPQLVGPVEVQVTFVMPRPKYHFRTGRHADLLRDNAPLFVAGKPDVDKLARNLLDALTAAAVVRDDAQVVVLHATKMYADPSERPGAHVSVMAARS